MDYETDVKYMREALREGRRALEEDEVPIGAVVVAGEQVLGRGYNRVERLKDATAHAEVIAIGAASENLGDWRLEGATLYVTVEPCMMCLGAAFMSRVSRVVYGAKDIRSGACGGAVSLGGLKYTDREVIISGGILEEECRGLLQEFFVKLREADGKSE
ncbi:MAG: nucleoside deaminase [bacterium]|jgi:tRNA(adenine34) deaminase